jgi:hypothetical protein
MLLGTLRNNPPAGRSEDGGVDELGDTEPSVAGKWRVRLKRWILVQI